MTPADTPGSTGPLLLAHADVTKFSEQAGHGRRGAARLLVAH
jgi:hypothetical protein